MGEARPRPADEVFQELHDEGHPQQRENAPHSDLLEPIVLQPPSDQCNQNKEYRQHCALACHGHEIADLVHNPNIKGPDKSGGGHVQLVQLEPDDQENGE